MTKALLPGVELGFIVAIFFLVSVDDAPRTEAQAAPARAMDLRSDGPEPTKKAADMVAAAPVLAVDLDVRGAPRYRLDGQVVTRADLAVRLEGLGDAVRLEIAPNVPYAHFQPLLTALSDAGLTPLVPTDAPSGAP